MKDPAWAEMTWAERVRYVNRTFGQSYTEAQLKQVCEEQKQGLFRIPLKLEKGGAFARWHPESDS